MNEPRILVGETVGRNNEDLEKSIIRVEKSGMYKDLSTIIICPTRGSFPTRVVQSWMKLMKPMNQSIVGPIFAESMKVDVAYENLIGYILDNDYLKKFKYILTIEEDNVPPSDGLIRLYEGMDKYDVIGGLYWGKGDDGFPMIFGDPSDPNDYKPQKPELNSLQECNGLGMGFTLFKTEVFSKVSSPWFKTEQLTTDEGVDKNMTQDLYFFKKAIKEGIKVACNTNVLVGHYDSKTDIMW